MRSSAPERGDRSLMSGILSAVTRFTSLRPTLTLWCVAIVAAAALLLTVRDISFKTKRADLIDPRADFQRRWNDYAERFGDASDIVVVVEADQPDAIKKVLEDLGPRMQKETKFFSRVLYKVEAGSMRGKGLQYFSPAQLEAGLRRLADYGPVLNGRWDLLRLDSLIDRLRYQINYQTRNNADEAVASLLRHGQMLSNSISVNFDNRNDFRSPWPQMLPFDRALREGPSARIYFLNEQGNIGFLKAFPAQAGQGFDGATASIARLRELIAEISPTYPGVQIGLTGIPVLESDEMHRSQTDIFIATLVSFVGVSLLLFLAFRGFRHPLLAMLMLVIGMAWSFGYITLVVGHLNVLSVCFVALMSGLGIGYAIHYLGRYLEFRHAGEHMRPALVKTSAAVGAGILTAAVTTALTFFSATFTEFLGVAELGIITGGAILLCAVATFVVLPSLISMSDRNREPQQLPRPFELTVLRDLASRFPWTVLIASIVVVLGVSSQALRFHDGKIVPSVNYDSNLLKLQADRTESVEIQKRIFHESNDSLLYAVSVANSAEEARSLHAKFAALPTVHHVEDLATRVPTARPEQSRLLVQSYRAQLARLPRDPYRLPAPDPSAVGSALERLFLTVRESQHPLAPKLAEELDAFLNRFETAPLKDQTQFLAAYQQRACASLLTQFQTLAASSDPEPLRVADLPEALTSRFVSSDGKWLIQVFPKEQIWDVEPLSRFVADVRSVDPEVTGTPLQNFEAGRQIRSSYINAALYSLAIICVVMLIDFLRPTRKLMVLLPPLAVVVFAVLTFHARGYDINYVVLALAYLGMAVAIAAFMDFENFCDILLAMLPPIAGGMLMFGVMGLLKADLNPANMIVLPLVLGTGVNNGVHILHDFRKQNGSYRMSASTVNGVVLTSMTTMVGFGSMMLAAHRGLFSVGMALTVGMASCLFVSLVMLPAILTLRANKRGKAGGASRTQESSAAKSAPKPVQQGRKAA